MKILSILKLVIVFIAFYYLFKSDNFDFNQDNTFEAGEEYRSPGWDRLKKRLIKWKK